MSESPATSQATDQAAAPGSLSFLGPAIQPGDLGTLGHYRVIDELGHGGMGFVFRAEDSKLKRSVALKVMRPKVAATPHSKKRFISEARAMAAIRHDNVVTIFEVGERNNTPFMAMEMLQGCTLERFNIDGRRLDYETIIEYAKQMARGLDAAHARGIIHRDIKPANIWIEESNERVKILDFGLALSSSPIDALAGRGAVIGTPGYLSPEQARSEPLDDRSDLYSMGVVLYELCTGRIPIETRSVPEQLIALLVRKPTPIREINPEIPTPLCDLIHRLLRKEPRARVVSAAALLEDLERVEIESHQKSEVAQAISQLKEGLNQVVQTGPLDSAASANDSGVDSLGEIPLSTLDPLSVSNTAIPLQPSPSQSGMNHPVHRPSKAAKGSGDANAVYLPLAIIVGVAIVALPLLTFAFTGMGADDQPVVILPDGGVPLSEYQADVARTAPPSASSQVATPTPTPIPTPAAAPSPPSSNLTSPPDPPSGATALASATSPETRNGDGDASGLSDPATMSSSIPESSSTGTSDDSVALAKPALDGPDSEDADAAPRDGGSPPPAPPPEPAKSWVTTVSTAMGRGADVMVQASNKQPAGGSPAVGIQSRGGVERIHTYLRFDLAELEKEGGEIVDAALLLTVVGDINPIGARLQVRAIDQVGMWPEDVLIWQRSFSQEGLDKFPILFDQTIGREQVSGKTVRLRSEGLTEHFRRSGNDVSTVVLSGAAGREKLLFVSKERSGREAAAPRLAFKLSK